MTGDIERILRESFLFGDFPVGEISGLAQICSSKKVARHERLYAAGGKGDSLFIVGGGSIRICGPPCDGGGRAVAALGPGGLFGEEAFIRPDVRMSTAEAVDSSWVLELSRSDFDMVFSKQPQFASKVMKRLAKIVATRLRATTDKIADSVVWGQDIRKWADLKIEALLSRQGFVEIGIQGEGVSIGRLLEVQRGDAGGAFLWESREGHIHWTPCHAVMYLRISGNEGSVRNSAGSF